MDNMGSWRMYNLGQLTLSVILLLLSKEGNNLSLGDKSLIYIGQNRVKVCENSNMFEVRNITPEEREICISNTWTPIYNSIYTNCRDINRINPASPSGYYLYYILGGLAGEVITECLMEMGESWSLLHWSVNEGYSGSDVESVIGDAGIPYDKLKFINLGAYYRDSDQTSSWDMHGFSLFAARLKFTDGRSYQLHNGGNNPCFWVAMSSHILPYTNYILSSGRCECLAVNKAGSCLNSFVVSIPSNGVVIDRISDYEHDGAFLHWDNTYVYDYKMFASHTIPTGKSCTFAPPNVKSCFDCENSCEECFGITAFDCATCPINNYLCMIDDVMGTGKCNINCELCQISGLSTYINFTSLKCQECDASCESCVVNSTNCYLCKDGSQIFCSQDGITGTCDTHCSGCQIDSLNTFPNFNNYCQKCDPNCYECSSSSINCTSCPPGMFLCPVVNGGLFGVCVNNCNICQFNGNNTYTNALTCSECDYRCAGCNGPLKSDCTSCKLTALVYDLGGVDCACTQNAYFNTSSSKCIRCGGYCGSCNSSSGLECLSCPPSRYMCLHTLPTFGSCVNSCNTECLNYNNKHTYSPLFPLNECSPCSTNCLTCSDSPTECITCPMGQILCPNLVNGHTYGTCVSDCALCRIEGRNSFVDGDICKVCNKECSTCDGPTSSDCFACNSSLVLCESPIGLSPKKGICIPSCHTCLLNNKHSYKDNTNICRECHDNCFECIESTALHCSSCPPNKIFCPISPILLSGGKCVSRCEVTCQILTLPTFKNDLLNICQQCHPNCEECIESNEADKCTWCPPSFKLQRGGFLDPFYIGNCVPNCPNWMYPESTTRGLVCKVCEHEGCKCTMGSDCPSCLSGYYSHLGSCVSICPNNYFANSTDDCEEFISECGDGKRHSREECDDGNSEDNDGCTDICEIERGWFCKDEVRSKRSICHCYPEVKEAIFIDSWRRVRLLFSIPIIIKNASGILNEGEWGNCEYLFSEVTISKLGEGSRCEYSGEKLHIELGMGTGVNDGSVIQFRGGTIYSGRLVSCGESYPMEDIGIKNDPNTPFLTPSFSMQIPPGIYISSDLHMKIMYGVGSPLREYRSIIFECSEIYHGEYIERNSTHLAEVNVILREVGGGRVLERYIGENRLAEGIYTFRISVTNFQGESYVVEKNVTCSDHPPIYVHIEGLPDASRPGTLRLFQMHTWSPIHLRAQIEYIDRDRDLEELSVEWELFYKGNGTKVEGVESISRSGIYLSLPPYSLLPVSEYIVKVECRENKREGRGEAILDIGESELVAKIRGGSHISWDIKRDLTLNGSLSYDPDAHPEDENRLEGRWAVCESSMSRDGVWINCIDGGVGLIYRLERGRIEWGKELGVTLHVRERERVASTTIYITTTNTLPGLLTIEDLDQTEWGYPIYSTNPDIRLIAKLNVYKESLYKDQVHYEWTVTPNNTQISETHSEYIRIPRYLSQIGDIHISLTVSIGNRYKRASLVIPRRDSPWGGSLTLHPHSGEALTTQFIFSAHNWLLPNNAIGPLFYAFYYTHHIYSYNTYDYHDIGSYNMTLLRSPSLSPYFSTFLTPGMSANNYTIYIILQISDSFGYYAQVKRGVTVTSFIPHSPYAFNQIIYNLLTKASPIDPQRSLPILLLASRALILYNHQYIDPLSNPLLNITQQLSLLLHNTPLYSYYVPLYYEILNNTFHYNPHLTDHDFNCTVNITLTLLHILPHIMDKEAIYLSTIINTLLLNIPPNDSYNHSKHILQLGTLFATKLTNYILLGDHPRKYKTPNFIIIAQKFDSSKDLSLGIDNYSLLSGPLGNKNIDFKENNDIQIADLAFMIYNQSVYNSRLERSKQNKELYSKIISIQLNNLNSNAPKRNPNIFPNDHPNKLQSPMQIHIPFDFTYINTNKNIIDSLRCNYFDQKSNKFSAIGLRVVEQNLGNNYILCETDHLSDFAIIKDNELTNVMQNANFAEATNFTKLENYVWYKSAVLWFSIGFLLMCLIFYMWAYSADERAKMLEHTFMKRFRYLKTNMVFGKQTSISNISTPSKGENMAPRHNSIPRSLSKKKSVKKCQTLKTSSAINRTEIHMSNYSNQGRNQRLEHNIYKNNWMKEQQPATKCDIYKKTLLHSHKLLGLFSYYDAKFLRTSRVVLFWSQIFLILIISGLFYNFSSGESMGENASLKTKLAVAILSVLFTIPFIIIMTTLLRTKAETDSRIIEQKTLMYAMEGVPFQEINENMRGSDNKRMIIAYVLGILIGLTSMVMSNTLAATFGTKKGNDWMLTFFFSIIYDLFIHQILKGTIIFLILISLGSSITSCGPCRKLCLKFITRSLLEVLR